MSINCAVLMGRITHDLELKTTPNNISVTTFRIAVDRNYTKPGEERQADFIDIVCWRQTADFVCRYFKKGSMIAVQGSIQTRNYEDKNGNKRTAVEIVADNVSFCGSKNDNQQGATSYTPNTQNAAQGDFEGVDDNDDGLPF